MDEKKEEIKEEEEEELESKSIDMVSKANEAALRLEKANEQHAKLLAKQEALAVERTLGGESVTTEKKNLTEEEKITQEAKEILKGTGFESMIN